LSTSFFRADNSDGHSKLSRPIWKSCRLRVHNYIKLMRSRSSNLQSISANTNVGMSSGLQWIDYTKSFFELCRSIFYANLDILVDNIRYLHDDSYEYKQPSEPYKPYKSNKSKLGDKSTNEDSANCGICNGTRPNCYCNLPISRSKRYYDDIGYRGNISRLDNDLISLQLCGEERFTRS